MIWQDAALGMAGLIGCFVAVVHGMLIQRRVVLPLQKHAIQDERIAAPIARLVAPLLQFSTFSWFLGGLALMVAAPEGMDDDDDEVGGVTCCRLPPRDAVGDPSAYRSEPNDRQDAQVAARRGRPPLRRQLSDREGIRRRPVQACIALMPGWISDVGRRLGALIERTVPGVSKAVK